MIPVRIYNHVEFFSCISASKLIAQVLNLLPLCYRDHIKFQLHPFISFRYNIFSLNCYVVTSSHSDENVPWLYIHPSVYMTMAKFSPVFPDENSLKKCSIGLFYVQEEMQLQKRPVISFKVQYCCFMLVKTLCASSNHLFPFRYNIFSLNCFVVTSSHSDENVLWLYIYQSIYNHGEVFSCMSGRKLIEEVLNWFIVCSTRDATPNQTCDLPESTILWFLKCPMVICTYSVHITMANVSPLF